MRLSYTPQMWGIQAERTVKEPSRRMSASYSELLTATIFCRNSGRASLTCWLNVGISGSSSISATSAVSAISAFWFCADMGAEESADWLCADFAEVADFADMGRVLTLIPASLAFWKNVLAVTPVPWERMHLSYWRSHSAWS